MILKTDCMYFPGDHPCIYNKQAGIKCDNCNYYKTASFRILIIKLDAVGDVLRTTSILPAVKRKYPDSHITWLTKRESAQLFLNNPFVDNLLFLQDDSLTARLITETFDLMIHPDASPVSSSLAAIVKAKQKSGFTLNSSGKVEVLNSEAEEWFEMGAFDEYKKKNKKTYQQIIHEIAGLEYRKDEIILNLTEEEKKYARLFYEKNNLDKYRILIGINTGSGSRWPLKQWPVEKYMEFIEAIKADKNVGILLFGGPDEEEKNRKIKLKYPEVIDSGSHNSLREFFALLNLSDAVITGDTMALHAAVALKKNVICLFGPTSSAEIEDYGRIRKVVPEMECLVCYKNSCDFIPNCMDVITTGMVMNELKLIYPDLMVQGSRFKVQG